MLKKKFPCLNLSGLLIYILDSIHVTKTHSKIKSPVEPDRPHLSFMAYNQQNTKKYTECLPWIQKHVVRARAKKTEIKWFRHYHEELSYWTKVRVNNGKEKGELLCNSTRHRNFCSTHLHLDEDWRLALHTGIVQRFNQDRVCETNLAAD